MQETASVFDTNSVLRDKGFEIHPNRALRIPEIDLNTLEQDVPDSMVAWAAGKLVKFFEGVAVSDSLGSDHNRRRELRDSLFDELVAEHGSENAKRMKDIYYESNKIRRNVLGSPVTLLDLIARGIEKIGERGIASQLDVIVEKIRIKFFGMTNPEDPARSIPDYNSLSDVEEKLKVVRYVEDRVIEALQIIADWQKAKGQNFQN